MSVLYLSWALQSLVQPFQGNHSTGSVNVRLAGVTPATVKPGMLGVPVIAGLLSPECVVKVDKNPATSDGSWPITTSSAVTCSSIQGGRHVNFSGGTVRWMNPPAGLADTGSAGSFSGGTQLQYGVQVVKSYKDIGTKAMAQTLFQAGVGRFPAVVLSWGASVPADGSTSANIGTSRARVANGAKLFSHRFNFFVISTRGAADHERQVEQAVIRDELMAMCQDRRMYRDLVLDAASGIQVQDARSVSATENSYVDAITISATMTVERSDARTFNPWVWTLLEGVRDRSDGVAQTVVNTLDPMPQS